MIRKSKLLICTLLVSMVLTVLPGMGSEAAAAEGETQTAPSGLQDENSQRLEEVTATGENGSIYQIGEADGSVTGENAEDALVQDEHSEIALYSDGSQGLMVVNFNTKGNAVTNYTDGSGRSGYTNGAYGADAAYLGMTADGQVRFLLSGVTGTVAASEVELVSYDQVAGNVSYYTVSGGKLIHYISQNLNSAPSSALNNGTAPSYLTEGGKYYSYDGHYFYTDYRVMSADYQAGTNGASAVNAGNPFYNYFQFLDMRTSTSYTGEQLESVLLAAMANAGIDPASSKLTGTGTCFVENQNTYSVNALLSLGIAINESGWGRSSICVNKNNIFGLNAVDSSPGQSADTFASVEECIRDFMKNWMAGGYLSASDWRNHGEYLGDKNGGINFSYASDPYWGEKAAAHAWNLDTIGGSRDYLGLGVSDDSTQTPPADEPDTNQPAPDLPSEDNQPSDPPSDDNPGADDSTGDSGETDGSEGNGSTDSTDKPETGDPSENDPAGSPDTDDPTVNEPSDEPETDDPSVSGPSDEPETDDPSVNEPTEDPEADEPSVNDPTDDAEADDPSEDPADGTQTDDKTSASDDGDKGNTPSGTIGSDQKGTDTKGKDSTGTGTKASSNLNTKVKAPQTGDTQSAAVWVVMLGLSAALGTGVILLKKRAFR